MNANEMFLLIESYLQHNNFAYNLYVAYMSLFESNNRHNEIINKAPGFFTMTQYALNKCMLLEFSKFYCGTGKERNILKLISIVEANLHLFPKEETQTLCNNAKKELETNLKPIIEKLKNRRNGDLAHNDPKFFDGLNNPAKENYIACEDIIKLYEFTFEILKSFIEALKIDKKVSLSVGADDFSVFIDEIGALIESKNNADDEKI